MKIVKNVTSRDNEVLQIKAARRELAIIKKAVSNISPYDCSRGLPTSISNPKIEHEDLGKIIDPIDDYFGEEE